MGTKSPHLCAKNRYKKRGRHAAGIGSATARLRTIRPSLEVQSIAAPEGSQLSDKYSLTSWSIVTLSQPGVGQCNLCRKVVFSFINVFRMRSQRICDLVVAYAPLSQVITDLKPQRSGGSGQETQGATRTSSSDYNPPTASIVIKSCELLRIMLFHPAPRGLPLPFDDTSGECPQGFSHWRKTFWIYRIRHDTISTNNPKSREGRHFKVLSVAHSTDPSEAQAHGMFALGFGAITHFTRR